MTEFGARSIDRVVPGRACGGCTLCCKLLGVEELNKPVGEWCPHCIKGSGCSIYETRPAECRIFYCAWMTNADLGAEWRPTVSKIVLHYEFDKKRLAAHVDPGFPLAWRREPYFTQLKEWSRLAVNNAGQVCIYIKGRVTVVLPTKEVDLGTLTKDDHIKIEEIRTRMGSTFNAYKIPQNEITPDQVGSHVHVLKEPKLPRIG